MIGVDVGICNTAYTVILLPKLKTVRSIPSFDTVKHVTFVAAKWLVTKPVKKSSSKVRDYARRVGEICAELLHVRACIPEDADVLWACETFVINPTQRISAATIQTLAVYGAVQGLALASKDLFMPVTPRQGKVKLLGKQKGSKEATIAALGDRVQAVCKKKIPKGKMEHVADAAAVALAGLHMFAETSF